MAGRYRTRIGVVASLAVVTFFCSYYALVARKTDISFDGAIFLQPVVALERFGTLTHTYRAESPADFRLPLTNLGQGLFSQAILNWPFIHFFGINHFTLQVANLIFLALTGTLVCVLIGRLTGNLLLAWIAGILFYTVPQIKYAGLGGLGEVPGTFYLLLCALLLHEALSDRRCYPWLGLAGFLAFHTKNYLILIYPALLLILAYLAIRQRAVRRRDIISFSIGFWVPFLILPAIFLGTYGWDSFLEEMRDFWFLFASTQWGTSLGEAERTSQLTIEAFRELSRNYGGWYLIYTPTLIIYILATLALILPGDPAASLSAPASEVCGPRRVGRAVWLPRLDATKAVVLLLLGLSVFYLAYWFHFSTWTLWYRRVLPFLILHIPLLMIVLQTFLRRPRQSLSRNAGLLAGIVALGFLGFAHLRYFALVFDLPTPDQVRLEDRIEATKVVNGLPADLQVFGIGWWQAPRVSLFSGRVFLDVTTQGVAYREGYLVLDPEAKVIDPEAVKAALSRWETSLIWKNQSYSLYRWNIRPVNLAGARQDGSLLLLEIGPKQASSDGSGFYPQPGNTVAMWARTEGATPATVLAWEDVALNSLLSRDGTVITATVPRFLFKTPGRYSISLFDPVSNQRSGPVAIDIAP
jgi:hypothetical protein